jgi:paraquat-inducible protein A
MTSLIACHECDLLQRGIALPAGGTACCRRCGGLLYRHAPGGLERTLACTLGALALFLVANAFPIVGLEVQGTLNASSLYGAVRTLWDQDKEMLAALVVVTTMLVPALELAVMTYLLLPLHLGRVPAGAPALLRLLQAAQPWSMVEVFMLGVLVSLVKLAHIAAVVPGLALWLFGGFILLLTASAATFNAHDVWERVGRP